jgi:phenylglyoxylate dehydrogenase epsilon subunit
MRHVIVGNGPAALSAVEALRRTDPACDITVVAGERARAYTPCFLSRFVSGEMAEESLALKCEDFYEKHRVTLLSGVAAAGVRPADNSLALADGKTLAYDRLLLACGATPLVPPVPGLAGAGVVSFKNFDDAVAIRALSALLGNVVVLGSGFVAVEIAEALVKLGMRVTMIARKECILRRIFDAEVAGLAEEHLARNGVRIVKQRELREVERFGQRRELTAVVLSRGERLPCDLLVVAVGMQPNLGSLGGTGIETARGVIVDDRMRTSVPNIFAAGDVAEIEIAGVRKVNLIHPNAVVTGRIAGSVMAGADARLEAHLDDMNVLTLFGLSFLSAGALTGGRVLERRHDARGLVKICAGDDGLVSGVQLVGNVTRGGLYRSLIRRRVPVAAIPDILSPRLNYGETLQPR